MSLSDEREESLPSANSLAEGSPPNAGVTREELHFRRIDMRGYRRSDGLLEVEGRVTDRKPNDFTPYSGGRHVPAGVPVHDMGVHDDHLWMAMELIEDGNLRQWTQRAQPAWQATFRTKFMWMPGSPLLR